MQAAEHAKEKEAASLELAQEKRQLEERERQLAAERETQSTGLGSRILSDTRVCARLY